MKKNEIIPWDLEEGAAMDYVDGVLYLVVKDDEWNENQLQAANDPFSVLAGETNGLLIFLLEGGPLDCKKRRIKSSIDLSLSVSW